MRKAVARGLRDGEGVGLRKDRRGRRNEGEKGIGSSEGINESDRVVSSQDG